MSDIERINYLIADLRFKMKPYCGSLSQSDIDYKTDIQANIRALESAKNALKNKSRLDAMESALKYYRDEVTGAEPSVSVFARMVDEVLENQQ